VLQQFIHILSSRVGPFLAGVAQADQVFREVVVELEWFVPLGEDSAISGGTYGESFGAILDDLFILGVSRIQILDNRL